MENLYVKDALQDLANHNNIELSDDAFSEDSFTSAQSSFDDPILETRAGSSPLLQLPTEVLQHVLTFLECKHLLLVLKTCRYLKQLAENDLLWVRLLQQQLSPEDQLPHSPYPSPSFRHLFAAHFPYWFLARNKIWFSNDPDTGKLILCKFDWRRGCIEGYQLLAGFGFAEGFQWKYKPSVLVHDFAPRLRLRMDDPVLRLPHVVPHTHYGRPNCWNEEIQMSIERDGYNIAASLVLARNIPEKNQSLNMELWPPRTIPNMPRVRAASGDNFISKGHKPQKVRDIAETAFRVRYWSQLFPGFAQFGAHLAEEVVTWSTIDPSLYTPTKEKPYQGIFVGDYAGHGCEFLLIIQTERAPPPPQRESSDHMRMILRAMQDHMRNDPDRVDETAQAEVEKLPPPPPNLDDDIAHSGALEAIKLTGDPNVPRGEHTFIADDIGRNGLVRIAKEEPFRGARVVKSRGHVAARGFQNDEFIPSQLIMISPDRLAQWWTPFGHISHYQRVDIDKLLAGIIRSNNGD